MRYEEMAGIVLREARQSGLRAYDIHSSLDTAELKRFFSARCVPEEWSREAPLWVEFNFEWDSVLTAYTVAGTRGICSMYHHSGEGCTHQEEWPHPVVLLEAIFTLPYEQLVALPVGMKLTRLGTRVRDLCLEAGLDGNVDQASFTVSVEEGTLRAIGGDISCAWAVGGDLLESAALLAERLQEICRQVRQALLQLNEVFPGPEEDQEGGPPTRGRGR